MSVSSYMERKKASEPAQKEVEDSLTQTEKNVVDNTVQSACQDASFMLAILSYFFKIVSEMVVIGRMQIASVWRQIALISIENRFWSR